MKTITKYLGIGLTCVGAMLGTGGCGTEVGNGNSTPPPPTTEAQGAGSAATTADNQNSPAPFVLDLYSNLALLLANDHSVLSVSGVRPFRLRCGAPNITLTATKTADGWAIYGRKFSGLDIIVVDSKGAMTVRDVTGRLVSSPWLYASGVSSSSTEQSATYLTANQKAVTHWAVSVQTDGTRSLTAFDLTLDGVAYQFTVE